MQVTVKRRGDEQVVYADAEAVNAWVEQTGWPDPTLAGRDVDAVFDAVLGLVDTNVAGLVDEEEFTAFTQDVLDGWRPNV